MTSKEKEQGRRILSNALALQPGGALPYALDLARAFVGMHTGKGIPSDLSGVFDVAVEDPDFIMEVLELAKVEADKLREASNV